MLLCEFNEVHRCHVTYCMIKMIKTTNNVMFEMSKESVRIIFPKYYTFINDTSKGCIYTHSLL
jgi:hypothetical protein